METAGNILIQKALEYLETAEAFAKSEVPAYLLELLRFKVFEHLVSYFDDLIACGIMFALALHFAKKLDDVAKEQTYSGDKDSFEAVAWVIRCIAALVLCISMFSTADLVQAYKAYAAPRVYLVEYFKNIATSKTENSK
jgi:hypothetical protein